LCLYTGSLPMQLFATPPLRFPLRTAPADLPLWTASPPTLGWATRLTATLSLLLGATRLLRRTAAPASVSLDSRAPALGSRFSSELGIRRHWQPNHAMLNPSVNPSLLYWESPSWQRSVHLELMNHLLIHPMRLKHCMPIPLFLSPLLLHVMNFLWWILKLVFKSMSKLSKTWTSVLTKFKLTMAV